METQSTSVVFNMQHAIKLHRLQPQLSEHTAAILLCATCHYANHSEYFFCTNCGHPLHDDDKKNLLHNMRIKQRKDLLAKCEKVVHVSRVVLYIMMATCIAAAIGYLLGSRENSYIYALVSMLSATLYFLLARWSYKNPFTALLTGFVIVMTFSTITVFGKFFKAFSTVQGMYGLIVCLIIIYFLLRGVQSAYKADLIKEEMQIV